MPTNYALKNALMRSPWTMKTVAEMIGITPARLSKIVGGYTRVLGKEKESLAALLGKPMEELFEGESKNASGI